MLVGGQQPEHRSHAFYCLAALAAGAGALTSPPLVDLPHLGRAPRLRGTLFRDPFSQLTVLELSRCVSKAGVVRQVEYALPDKRAPLPGNLTFCSFHLSPEGVFIRAAVLAGEQELLPSREGGLIIGRRTLRVTLHGKGLPFAAGDCLGWSHSGRQGLAYMRTAAGATEPNESPDEAPSGMAALTEFFTSVDLVSSFRPLNAFVRLRRSYAVRFNAEVSADPFVCWKRQPPPQASQPAATAEALHFGARTQLSCCYFSPLMTMSNELPSCFGVVEEQPSRPGGSPGYVWYHPSHCCADISLAQAMINSVRCEASKSQAPWRRALEEAAKCQAICCPGSPRPCEGERLLATGRSPGTGLRNDVKGGPVIETEKAEAGAGPEEYCPAAMALLGLLSDDRAGFGDGAEVVFGAGIANSGETGDGVAADVDASANAFRLQAAGRVKGGLCAAYGFDHAECCLNYACPQGAAGATVASCMSCLLAEVPWGHWSWPQRILLAHMARKLGSPVGPEEVATGNLPATLHGAVRKLLNGVRGGDGSLDGGARVHAGVAKRSFAPLLGILLQVIAWAGGSWSERTLFYDAVHALQVASPLRAFDPAQLAQLLEELPPQGPEVSEQDEIGLASESGPSALMWLCTRWPRWPATAVTATTAAIERQAHNCGVAAAAARWTFLVAGGGGRGPNKATRAQRCCQREAWPALARAAAEGGCWPPAVFALCAICEAAPVLGRERARDAVAFIDTHLASCGRVSPATCGHATWAPLVSNLRARTLCPLRSLVAGRQASHGLPRRHKPRPLMGSATVPASIRVRSHSETLAFLQAGGSLMRMNDGEQLMMHPGSNAPLTRLADTALRLQLAARATCPGLCVGLLHPDDEEAVSALGPSHRTWWLQRGFKITRALLEAGVLPSNRTYCFGLATYRPKVGPSRMSTVELAEAWDLVFANRSVLLVQPPGPDFFSRCGGCVQISELLYGHGRALPPFRLASALATMHPGLVKYSGLTGAEWPSLVSTVRTAADVAMADTVAVVWGPSADILVAEVACRGLRAIDIGNLMSILEGGSAARRTDPDDGGEEVTLP